MEQTYYLISDAAKKVQVESHVLRYWEEELGLPIKRNELGHRFYTEEDIKRFISIKGLKEKGLQLKAIKLVLQDDESFDKETEETEKTVLGVEKRAVVNTSNREEKMEKELGGKKILSVITKTSLEPENKSARMQMLLKQMIMEAIKDSNEELCDSLKESLLKEMDYQFRLQEEREEERESSRTKREDEHFQRIDELLRSRSKERGKFKNKDNKDKEKIKAKEKEKENDTENGKKKRRHSFF
ncbi:MAG: helix-turn-helix domain-containing protein [Lachnospiraceae bacterium]|nr:helix-turn-helix domain-containing protein [Lachnospiraceae bacterium]